MEVLSEHLCQGWLEGYLLTGRHGLFDCYEAFIHIVDSMVNQHAKWLKMTREIPWRRPIAVAELPPDEPRLAPGPQRLQPPGPGLHRPRREQEGRGHPGLPAAGREHACCRSPTTASAVEALRQRRRRRQAAGAQLPRRWTRRSLHCARRHRRSGTGPSNDVGEPDVVLACAGDVPTLEALAAAAILRAELPDLRVRFVNVVDLMRLQPAGEHPHGLSDEAFDALFTTDRPVVFAYHGYPWLIHRLSYRRTNHANLHVRGLQGGGHGHDPVRHGHAQRPRPLPPRDGRDRPGARSRIGGGRGPRQRMVAERERARAYARETGDDPADIRDWAWPG